MDATEATTRILEAYLRTDNPNAVRTGQSLTADALHIAKAFQTIYEAVYYAYQDRRREED